MTKSTKKLQLNKEDLRVLIPGELASPNGGFKIGPINVKVPIHVDVHSIMSNCRA